VFCNAGWSTEQWAEFGVEEFPDLAAVQQFRQALDDINWFRYVDTRTTLGTTLEHS